MRTTARFHPRNPILLKRTMSSEKLSILMGVNVIGDNRHVVMLAHGPT
jgi:hypothetical protein